MTAGIVRNLTQIDGAVVPKPTQNGYTATGLEVFANDAAYEAAYPSFGQGSKYFNSTELLEREHDGTSWVYVNKALTATTDAATTGTDNDLSATRFDLIRFTEGSLQSIRSIDPAQHKIIYMVNDQASQSITWVNEDGTATAANTIITGTGDDLIQEVDQVLAFIYDSESSRWRIAGGTGSGGGGLEIAVISNADSPVTGEIGKWYLTDTSAGPITVNMPDLSAIPSSKQASASMRFSDCKANWQVQPVTLVPFSGQSIDGAVADETMVLDVESQYVWCARETASNWCFDTNIQPTLESGGGSGEGRVNLFPNSDFEDGTTDWSSTKQAQIGLETSTPLQGAQSLKITSDGAGQVVSTTLTVSDDAYKTIQHGIEGVIDIPLTATTGDWVARFKRNGTTIANSESDLAPGRNRLQDLLAGFAPLLDTISFEIEDVSASASDVATCDIFVLTPQGQGNVTEWPSYDQSEVSITSALAGFSIVEANFRPERDGSGVFRLNGNFQVSKNNAADSAFVISIAGIAFGSSSSQHVNTGLSSSNVGRSELVTESRTSGGTGNISFETLGTGSFDSIYVEFDVVLDSWPTWATKGGNIQLLDNNGLYQNAKGKVTLSADSGGYNDNSNIPFDVSDVDGIEWDDINKRFVVKSEGRFRVGARARVTTGSGATGSVLRIYGGSKFTQGDDGGTGSSINLSVTPNTFKLSEGDFIRAVLISTGTNGTIFYGTSDFEATYLTVERIPDSTGNQATGAGTSSLANENPQNVLVNYQKKTITLTNDGAQNINATIDLIRIGNVVTLTSDGSISHDSSSAPISSIGAIPEYFRPKNDATYNTYHIAASPNGLFEIRVDSDGEFRLGYRDWSGADRSRVDSNGIVSISYIAP